MSLEDRAQSLNRAAWLTLEELVATFRNGGSFQTVAGSAEILLDRRRALAADMLRQAVRAQMEN